MGHHALRSPVEGNAFIGERLHLQARFPERTSEARCGWSEAFCAVSIPGSRVFFLCGIRTPRSLSG